MKVLLFKTFTKYSFLLVNLLILQIFLQHTENAIHVYIEDFYSITCYMLLLLMQLILINII